MSQTKPESLIVYEIGTARNFDAYFVRRTQCRIDPGEDADAKLALFMEGRLPREQQQVSPEPNGRKRHERLLDIAVETGAHLYAIRLNAPYLPSDHHDQADQSLYFQAHDPLPQFGVEGSWMAGLLRDPKAYVLDNEGGEPKCHAVRDGQALWASFIFDTADLGRKPHDPALASPQHGKTIRVPFYYNVRDGLGEPTWAELPPSEPPTEKSVDDTHGGAHPPLGSYLVWNDAP